MKYCIETKFDVGDTVWTMHNNLPTKRIIYRIVFKKAEYERYLISESSLEFGITCNGGGFHYEFVGGDEGYDSNCFSTKEELIDYLFKSEI